MTKLWVWVKQYPWQFATALLGGLVALLAWLAWPKGFARTDPKLPSKVDPVKPITDVIDLSNARVEAIKKLDADKTEAIKAASDSLKKEWETAKASSDLEKMAEIARGL